MSWNCCPECGGKLNSVIDSRWKTEDKTMFVYRRYMCLNQPCQHRFSTMEMLIDIIPGKSILGKDKASVIRKSRRTSS